MFEGLAIEPAATLVIARHSTELISVVLSVRRKTTAVDVVVLLPP